jgi:hypothetical protein
MLFLGERGSIDGPPELSTGSVERTVVSRSKKIVQMDKRRSCPLPIRRCQNGGGLIFFVAALSGGRIFNDELKAMPPFNNSLWEHL